MPELMATVCNAGSETNSITVCQLCFGPLPGFLESMAELNPNWRKSRLARDYLSVSARSLGPPSSVAQFIGELLCLRDFSLVLE